MRSKPHWIRLQTVSGLVEIRTVYGLDKESGRWLCPIRVIWGLEARQEMSPELEERLCASAVETSSYEAAARVARKWGISADDSTIHAHVQKAGLRAEQAEDRRVESALCPSTRAEVVAQAQAALPREDFSLVIQMDGCMVRERGAQWGLKPSDAVGERVAWHELKVATIFRLSDRAQSQTGRAMLLDKFQVLVRGDPQEFGRHVHAQALRRGLQQAQKVYVVADGAVWIWNIVEDRFCQAIGLVDFYHASQHLWSVAHVVHGDDDQARQWIEPLLHQLRHGEHGQVVDLLEIVADEDGYDTDQHKVLRREATYFQTHREHMNYHDAARQGLPIGSGAVESTCKQTQGRFKHTGQFWSLPTEKNLLALYMAYRNNDWQEIWSVRW